MVYAMVCTRPNIAHVVGVVSRFFANPTKEQWVMVKWILRLLRGTSKGCLCFGNDKSKIEGFTHADWGGDMNLRNSTLGYVFTFAGGNFMAI